MKIDKITYQKTYSIGPYLTDRVGFEATVDEYENISDALDMLKKEADDWHKEANPHLYQEEKYPQPFPNPNRFDHITDSKQPAIVFYERSDLSPESILADIQKAKSLEELRTYKLLAGGEKELYNAYNQRLKELTNG